MTDVAPPPTATTRTVLTLTIEADGFIGKRQADAAAREAARWLRTVLPYDVRHMESHTTVVLGEGGNFEDLLDGTELAEQLRPTRDNVLPMGEFESTQGPHREATDSDYYGMTVEDLRNLAGEREIEGRSTLRTKAELIAALEADDEATKM